MNNILTVNTNSTEIKYYSSANTLFKYTKELKYLLEILDTLYISPRYLYEDFSFLRIYGLKEIAIPMICFCDIPISKVREHVKKFGSYGIGLDKNLLINKYRLQPLNYINYDSDFVNEYKTTFEPYFSKTKIVNKDNEDLLNLVFSILLYLKPINNYYLNPSEKEKVNFKDESEWRYIPINKMPDKYNLLYYKEQFNEQKMKYFSDSLKDLHSCGMEITYEMIKYLIVENDNLRIDLIKQIEKMKIIEFEKDLLISKIYVINNTEEDIL